MILASFKQKEVDERIELKDEHSIAILNKMAKQHHDSIEQFSKANRDDLVKKEQLELEKQKFENVKQMEVEEVREKVRKKSKMEMESLRSRFKMMQTAGTLETRSPSLSESELSLEVS